MEISHLITVEKPEGERSLITQGCDWNIVRKWFLKEESAKGKARF
jgi:hypothetical protein